MPEYKWRIDDILFEEDVKKIYDIANGNTERVLISMLWITGARPAEFLRSKINENKAAIASSFKLEPNKVTMNLSSLKKSKGEGGQFKVKTRTLEFERPSGNNVNLYLETIVNHVGNLHPESEVMPYTTRWAEKVVNRLGVAAIGKPLSPYHFRHSVMTWLAHNGYTPDQLMYFKGAESLTGVTAYIHARPQLVNLQNIRRNRTVEQPKIEPEPQKIESEQQKTEQVQNEQPGTDSV